MARSVADIQFLDTIFNRCPRKDTEIDLRGYKIGYPREWWHDIGDEVSPAPAFPASGPTSTPILKADCPGAQFTSIGSACCVGLAQFYRDNS